MPGNPSRQLDVRALLVATAPPLGPASYAAVLKPACVVQTMNITGIFTIAKLFGFRLVVYLRSRSGGVFSGGLIQIFFFGESDRIFVSLKLRKYPIV